MSKILRGSFEQTVSKMVSSGLFFACRVFKTVDLLKVLKRGMLYARIKGRHIKAGQFGGEVSIPIDTQRIGNIFK